MKITRKEFLTRSSLTALGIGLMPRLSGMTSGKGSITESKKLGNTDIEVTTLGFGAARTQEPGVLKAALNKGITFLDTGRRYANGQNEVMIGKTLKGTRERYVIQSKMKVDLEGGSASAAKIRRQMETSLEESLKALQTDYIDVILLHGIGDEGVMRNETIRKVLTEMKEKGAIRAHGFSTHNHVSLLREQNRDPFYDVVMVPFNPFGGFQHSQSDWSTSWDQEALIAEMKKAHAKGTAVVAMKTCSGGKHAFKKGEEPSYSGAVQWVRSQGYVHTTAVAMASFEEIDAHT
ncbi:MAG: aldo/keto reductase [Bacteroidales bacterium]|nr:aldo/keto reductase [Bacteroidales bacterium]